jgi:hypothetical protein
LTIYPVKLRICSIKISDNDRSKSPWKRLARLFDDGFNIKKNDKMRPWNTPMKRNTDNTSM